MTILPTVISLPQGLGEIMRLLALARLSCPVVLGFCLATTAAATCSPAPIVARSLAGGATLEQRFEALVAEDPEVDSAAKLARWRVLVSEAEALPGVAPALRAQLQGGLAYALGSADPEPAHALEAARRAQDMVVQAGLSGAIFNIGLLATLANAEAATGDLAAARKHAAAALTLAVAGPGEVSAEGAVALNASAFAAYSSGEFERGRGLVTKAAAAARKCMPANSSFTVEFMSSQAGMEDAAGLQEQALATNEQVVAWALDHLPPESMGTNLALNNLGVSLRNVNRLAEAESILRLLLDRQAKYETNVWATRATTLSSYATTIDMQGRHKDAEALWLQARGWWQKAASSGDVLGKTYPLRFAAEAALARGDNATALARRKQAVAEMVGHLPNDHPELARARLEYADSVRLAGARNEALAIATQAVEVVRAKLAIDSVRRIGAELIYARVVGAALGPQRGYEIAAELGQRAERKLLDVSTATAELIRYSNFAASVFATVADFAFASGHEEEGFHAIQVANLSETMLVANNLAVRAAARDLGAHALVVELQDRVRNRRQFDQQRSYAVSANDNEGAKRSGDNIAANDRRIAEIVVELDRVFPAFHSLSRPAPLSLATVRAQMEAGQVLLAPLPLADGVLATAVTREGLVWERSTITGAQVSAAAGAIRASIAARERSSGAAARFPLGAASTMFEAIAPGKVGLTLRKHSSILYFANGAFAAIPPALLVTRRVASATPAAATPWLIRSHDVTVLPSMAALARPPVTAMRGSSFLGVGAPSLAALTSRPGNALHFRDGIVEDGQKLTFPPLPGAARELAEMARAFGPGRSLVLTGGNATELSLRRRSLGKFGVLAFATHGLSARDVAGLTEPALLLTAPRIRQGSDDGLLTASEIATLPLAADWVILSACNSAAAIEAGSPPYSGLATAFLQAGARSLLVSHWPVRDDVAARLTVDTLRGAAGGLSRAKALQGATLRLMADRRTPGAGHPAMWAPFVLLGR